VVPADPLERVMTLAERDVGFALASSILEPGSGTPYARPSRVQGRRGAPADPR
jgi:hypothetical protein